MEGRLGEAALQTFSSQFHKRLLFLGTAIVFAGDWSVPCVTNMIYHLQIQTVLGEGGGKT